MTTIKDIMYDMAYSQASRGFFLLYTQYNNHDGPTPVILLPYASLMTFVNAFHSLNQCQLSINGNNQRTITLFVSDGKIQEWNDNIQVADHYIEKVYIFCESFENYSTMKRWDGCYRNKIKKVYLPDKDFQYDLLDFGVKYIRKVMPEFRQDRQVYRKLGASAKRLLHAMEDYFQDEVDNLDDDLGEEAQ